MPGAFAVFHELARIRWDSPGDEELDFVASLMGWYVGDAGCGDEYYSWHACKTAEVKWYVSEVSVYHRT